MLRSHIAFATTRQALGYWLKTVTALFLTWDKRLELPGMMAHACHPSKPRLHSELHRKNIPKNNSEILPHKHSHQISFDGPLHVSPWPRGTDSTGQLSTGSSSQHGCVQIKPNPLLSAADPVTKNPRVRGQNCTTSSVVETETPCTGSGSNTWYQLLLALFWEVVKLWGGRLYLSKWVSER